MALRNPNPEPWEQAKPTKRPPRAWSVVRNEPAEPVAVSEASLPIDWSSWYLTDEEDMGEAPEHFDVASLFLSIMARHARKGGFDPAWYISGNAFFAWVEDEPLVRVSPDVYVVGHAPEPLPASFQTWLPEHEPPLFALEVVSERWKKDYVANPDKYALLGARELLIFDRDAAVAGPGWRSDRFSLQLYRRMPDDAFVLVYSGRGPVRLETLGLYAVTVVERARGWVRLATDAAGSVLLPTAVEAGDQAEARRDEAEARRDEAEAKLDAAEAELAVLRAKIARLETPGE